MKYVASHKIRSRWQKMLARCGNPSCERYNSYGGRGITVCERWMKFENFYADMGRCPEGFSLERIDNDKGYYPENCKWIPLSEQHGNKQNTIRIEYGGVTRFVTEWERALGLRRGNLRHRLSAGWDLEEALFTPRDASYGTKEERAAARGTRRSHHKKPTAMEARK